MNGICPAIQSVSPHIIATFLEIIQSDKLTSGPAAMYDEENGVFISIIVERGVMVRWQMVSCGTPEQAVVEREVFMRESAALARILASGMVGSALPNSHSIN